MSINLGAIALGKVKQLEKRVTELENGIRVRLEEIALSSEGAREIIPQERRTQPSEQEIKRTSP